LAEGRGKRASLLDCSPVSRPPKPLAQGSGRPRTFSLIPRPSWSPTKLSRWWPGKSSTQRHYQRQGDQGDPLTSLGGQNDAAGLIWAVERRDSPFSQSFSKSSCASARRAGYCQGTTPSALPGSMTMFGCFSHQPEALTCHPQRGRPANTGLGGVPQATNSARWPAVLTLKRAALRVDDVVASHRAADGA
jgi:hypothetical protein